eukprot:3382141-Prymnesium_polylepis.1
MARACEVAFCRWALAPQRSGGPAGSHRLLSYHTPRRPPAGERSVAATHARPCHRAAHAPTASMCIGIRPYRVPPLVA